MKTNLNKRQKALLKVCLAHQISYNQLTNDMKAVRQALEGELFFQQPKRCKKAFMRPTLDQYRAYFKAFDAEHDPQFKTAALFIYGTGARIGELTQIKITDIDFERLTVKVIGEKTGKERIVLFPNVLKEILKSHIKYSQNKVWLFEHDGQRYSTRRFQQVFKGCRERAGITVPITAHTGRHELISILTENNWQAGLIRQQSGHSSDGGVKSYQHQNNLLTLQPEYQKAVSGFFQAVL